MRTENASLQERVRELEETLRVHADAVGSKPPKVTLNYSSQRNDLVPKSPKRKRRCKKSQKKTGRKPKEAKTVQADQTIKIYPEGISHRKCVLRREQFVWRLIDKKAQYVHYLIFDTPDSKNIPEIPGVRNRRCEYGIEFIIMLAHHVYWMGLSIDKSCELIQFYTGIKITKSQADTLLYQLAFDWEPEYERLAELIAAASILYVDETGWKKGKKSCYTWVFGTIAEVYYCCGVGRGKDVLTKTLGEHFAGIGVTDDYACYDSIFSQHQLCWAHFLRKAAELMLRNPTVKAYQRFYLRLLLLYRLAKRYQNDARLTLSRAAKVRELQQAILKLCTRCREEIVTEKQAEKNGLDPSCVTSESDAKLIRLQKELVEHLDNLFVFVEHPDVGSTNNQSERDLRGEALARKTSRTSKTQKGANRRGIIISVLGTLRRRLQDFSLDSILKCVFESYQLGISLFSIIKPPETQ